MSSSSPLAVQDHIEHLKVLVVRDMEVHAKVTEQTLLLPAQRVTARMERLHQSSVGLQLQMVDVFPHRRRPHRLMLQGLAFDLT